MTDRNFTPNKHPELSAGSGISRREMLAGVVGTSLGLTAMTQKARAGTVTRKDSSRKLIRNATIVTMDGGRRILPKADILVEGRHIAAIGPTLGVTDAELIDASQMIAIPGFVDSHHHMWPGCIRQSYPDDTVADYFANILTALGPRYRPEDVLIGNLVAALSAIDAGFTTVLDWSHISNTPAHSDAAIEGLKEAGIRGVYALGPAQVGINPFDEKPPRQDVESLRRKARVPEDLRRLRKQYFSSEDQLLTLALGADGPSHRPVESAIAEWKIANEVQARISVHLSGAPTLDKFVQMQKLELLKAETTYIHCTDLPAQVWEIIKETGGSVAIAPTAEMLQAALPATQDALDHGFRPSVSVDSETDSPNDMFTQMRVLLAVQRAAAYARMGQAKNAITLLKAEDLLEFATLSGAKANGLEKKAGSLEVGKEADIVLLRKNRINTLPVSNPVGSIVLGMDTGNVDSVFVAGRALKRDGKLLGVDLAALERRAQASQDYLLAGVRT